MNMEHWFKDIDRWNSMYSEVSYLSATLPTTSLYGACSRDIHRLRLTFWAREIYMFLQK